MKFDWVIIGQGLSAYSAAVKIRKKGASVAIISKGPGASAVSSGAWSLGTPHQDESFEEHWQSRKIRELLSSCLSPEISQVRAEDVKQIINNLASSLSLGLEIKTQWGRPFCIPTSSGAWRTEYVVQAVQSQADIELLKGKKTGLMGSDRWRFSYRAVADQLMKSKPDKKITIVPVEIDLPATGLDYPLTRVSAWLMQDKGAIEVLAESINRAASKFSLEAGGG